MKRLLLTTTALVAIYRGSERRRLAYEGSGADGTGLCCAKLDRILDRWPRRRRADEHVGVTRGSLATAASPCSNVLWLILRKQRHELRGGCRGRLRLAARHLCLWRCSRLDLDRSQIQQPIEIQNTSAWVNQHKIDWLASFRGRMGLAVQDTLVYVTGGVAVGHDQDYKPLSQIKPLPISATTARSARTKVGWVAGGGVEHRWNRNWSFKAEALYYDLGNTRRYGHQHWRELHHIIPPRGHRRSRGRELPVLTAT